MSRRSLINLHGLAAFAQLSQLHIPTYNGPWPGEKTIKRWEEPRPEGEASPEQKAIKPKKVGKKTRAQRKRDAKKLSNNIETISNKLCKEFKELLSGSTCSVCGEKASGVGGNLFYCEKHFWPAFETEHGEKTGSKE